MHSHDEWKIVYCVECGKRYNVIEAWKEILSFLIYYFLQSLELAQWSERWWNWNNWEREQKQQQSRWKILHFQQLTHTHTRVSGFSRCTVWGFHTGYILPEGASRLSVHTLNHIHQHHFRICLSERFLPAEQQECGVWKDTAMSAREQRHSSCRLLPK